jgi:hypothetical protein
MNIETLKKYLIVYEGRLGHFTNNNKATNVLPLFFFLKTYAPSRSF